MSVAARHAEIARRYARHRRERFGPYDRGRHRCAEVSKLAMHRRKQGNGFDPNPVIDDIKHNARMWTAAALGRRLNLTWAERCQLRLRTIEASDLSPAELKRKKRERKAMLHRARQARYKRRQTTKKQSANAARQARFRARKRNACGDATVQPLEMSENASAMRVFYTSRPIAQQRQRNG